MIEGSSSKLKKCTLGLHTFVSWIIACPKGPQIRALIRHQTTDPLQITQTSDPAQYLLTVDLWPGVSIQAGSPEDLDGGHSPSKAMPVFDLLRSLTSSQTMIIRHH
eukprot:1161258-Pelagomonas_calceolata.AAC.2